MPRKEKKYHFIYKTTNLLNGKYYIGMHSTDNLNDGYLGSGKRLRYSIKKYGKEYHRKEIIEFFNTRDELAAKEREIVCLNEIAKDKCLNLVVGGDGGRGFTFEERERAKIAASTWLKEKWSDEDFRKRQSKLSSERLTETNKTMTWHRKSFLNKQHSEETKKLMSESSKGMGSGEMNSQHGTCWITKDKKNKKIKITDFDDHQLIGWVKGRYYEKRNN